MAIPVQQSRVRGLLVLVTVLVWCTAAIAQDPVYRDKNEYPVLDEIEAARDAVQAERDSIRAAVEAEYEAEKKARAVALETRFEESPDIRIPVDPLRKVVVGLLRNAVEVSESVGVEIRADRKEDETGAFVCIEIADHGPGVPVDLRDKIFEPYFTTRELGTGLGLAIVQQTVNAHGGSVSVSETEDGGANFIMKIPESQ